MKQVVRVFAFVSMFCILPLLHAADVSGTWKGSFDFQGNSIPLVFHLKNQGTALTGTIDGLPTTPADIHDGKMDGSTVSFWVDTDYQGQTYKIVYSGKVTGDHIDFDFGTDDGSWGASMTVTKGSDSAAPQK